MVTGQSDTTDATVARAIQYKLVILGLPKSTTSVSLGLAITQSAMAAMAQSTMVQFQMRFLLLFRCHTSLATRFF